MNEASVIERIVIEGRLMLESPLLIGAGEDDGVTDLLVLKDKWERPFIPGTSLAGALRAALRAAETEERGKLLEMLFGGLEEESAEQRSRQSNGTQSAVVVEDVVLEDARTVIRDGVGIDFFTGVGIDGCKYDYEAVDRGAQGRFYLLVTLRRYHEEQKDDLEKLARILADQLAAGISLGALTTKGFGRVKGVDVTVKTYDFSKKEAVRGWLLQDGQGVSLYQAHPFAATFPQNFDLSLDCALEGSLIVREEADDEEADANQEEIRLTAIQLKSGSDYVIPGTTIKGIWRRQAARILGKLGRDSGCLDFLMGCAAEDKKQKSRLYTEEVYFRAGVKEAPQPRNRIDRFTGGGIEGALFKNRPVWQEKDGAPVLHMRLLVKDCKEWEAGLLLFILKDVWTGSVAFGGEKSVGRGRLRGVKAEIQYQGETYRLFADGDGVNVDGDKEKLESYAGRLLSSEESEPA